MGQPDVVRRIAEQNPAATVQQIARESRLTVDEVAERLGEEEVLLRRQRNDWAVGHSRDELLSELRRVAALPGGTPLTGPFYDEHRSPGSVVSARLIQLFDTWTSACEAAGVEPRRAVRDNYRRRWDEDACVQWAARFVDDVGAMSASYARFSDWLRDHKREGAPSAQTVRNILGTWAEILALVAARRAD